MSADAALSVVPRVCPVRQVGLDTWYAVYLSATITPAGVTRAEEIIQTVNADGQAGNISVNTFYPGDAL